jgi:hypothetical protein
MTTLYNCKHDGDQYRMTKFDRDLTPESTYLCTERECECPAGHRPMCRHREMLPMFIAREAVGTGWFYDYERGGWVQMWDEPIGEAAAIATVGEIFLAETVPAPGAASATEGASPLNSAEDQVGVNPPASVADPAPRKRASWRRV